MTTPTTLTGPDVFDLFSLKFLRRPLLKAERHIAREFHRLVQEQIYNITAEEHFILSRLDEIEREKKHCTVISRKRGQP